MTAPPAREDDDAPDLVWHVTTTEQDQVIRERAERDAATAKACSGWLSAE